MIARRSWIKAILYMSRMSFVIVFSQTYVDFMIMEICDFVDASIHDITPDSLMNNRSKTYNQVYVAAGRLMSFYILLYITYANKLFKIFLLCL